MIEILRLRKSGECAGYATGGSHHAIDASASRYSYIDCAEHISKKIPGIAAAGRERSKVFVATAEGVRASDVGIVDRTGWSRPIGVGEP